MKPSKTHSITKTKEIVKSFVEGIGVPHDKLDQMCEQIGINKDLLLKWINGQTQAINSRGVTEMYVWDIIRFVEGQPVID